MKLRYYQEAADAAIWEHIAAHETNPVVVLPTGAGKSLVIATICRRALEWGGAVMVLAHRKELLRQNADELRAIAPEIDSGIYSAGLDQRDVDKRVTFAGIQSVFRRPTEFEYTPNLVIVDEAHLVPADGDGMYRTFLEGVRAVQPTVRLIGLTATPFRTSSGWLCTDEGPFHTIVHDTPVRELIDAGYLSPLTSNRGIEFDTSGLKVKRGEFEQEATYNACMDVLDEAVEQLIGRTTDRKSTLVFCQGVDHAEKVLERLQAAGESAKAVFGHTHSDDRGRILEEFKAQEFRYLVNVDVLTTGFNARGVDCVALLRPTMSPGLYCQMVGRGLRLSPETGKTDCLVLDFGGNIELHGPIDDLRVRPKGGGKGKIEPVMKVCPECGNYAPFAQRYCKFCGYVFPRDEKEVGHDAKPSNESILTGEGEKPDPVWHEVMDVHYTVHKKKGAADDHPRTLRVEYDLPLGRVSEWICIEHEGFARGKAERWWEARTETPCPRSAEKAWDIADGLRIPDRIAVQPDGKYERIVDYEWTSPDEPSEPVDVDATIEKKPEVDENGNCVLCGFPPDASCKSGTCWDVPF